MSANEDLKKLFVKEVHAAARARYVVEVFADMVRAMALAIVSPLTLGERRKAFTATRPDRKYCSPNCAAAAYRDRNRTRFEPRACLWCGTMFTPTHHAKAQFCSVSCRHSYRYRHSVNPGTIVARRTGGVDRAKVEAYLRLPDDERYARRKELNQAERLLAMRIWNQWHLREEW